MKTTRKRKATKQQRAKTPDAAQIAALVAESARRRRDIALAHERIGTTINARCDWLLEKFVPYDPDTLATADRPVLRDNLLALAEGHPWTAPSTLLEWDAAKESDLPAEPHGQGTWSLHDPPDAELHGLWQKIVSLTRAHTAAAGIGVPLPPVREHLWMQWKSGQKIHRVRLERYRYWPDLTTAVLHHVADLLAACTQLRECSECHLLLVGRRRQERHEKCARIARDKRRPSRQKKGA